MTENDKAPVQTETSSASLVNVEVSDIFGLKPVGKWGELIIEKFAGAVGWVYQDVTARGRVKREAENKILTSKAETDSAVYHITEMANANHEAKNETPNLLQSIESRAAIRTTSQAVRQQENLEDILRSAVDYAEDKDTSWKSVKNNDKNVSNEWLDDFIDLSKNTSTKNMKRLWGRVLAEETKKPGSFNIRCLMTLKTMSHEEGLLFQRTCQISFNNIGIIKNGHNMFMNTPDEMFGLSYKNLLVVKNSGLINHDDHLGINVDVKKRPYELFYSDKTINIISSDKDTSNIPAFLFTDVGDNLSDLIDVDVNQEYLDSVIGYLKSLGCEVQLLD